MTRPAITSTSTSRTGHGLRPKLEFLAALMLSYTAHAHTLTTSLTTKRAFVPSSLALTKKPNWFATGLCDE